MAKTTTKTVTNGNGNIDLEAELAKLRAENEALKVKQALGRGTWLKVSDKGAVSVYGLGRFPVTLYQEQMLKLLAMSGEIQAFIRDNAANLSTKG
jgi:hypothetical protein